MAEYRELCELRLALESHAARLAAINRPDSDLHEIAQAREAMRRITKAGRDAHRRLVLQSHDAVFRAVEQREANAAHAAMEEHIQDIINRSVRTVAGAEAGPAGKELSEEELSYTP